jgi:hypothetical protein
VGEEEEGGGIGEGGDGCLIECLRGLVIVVLRIRDLEWNSHGWVGNRGNLIIGVVELQPSLGTYLR